MSFTPITSGIGALFLQLASTNHYAQIGETLGFSSILSNSFLKFDLDSISILLGLISSTTAIKSFAPAFIPSIPNSNLITNGNVSQWVLYSIGGLLVGLGTKLGRGCTSGHMIGGLSRLRVRSLAAVATFAGVAMTVVKALGLGQQADVGIPNYVISNSDGDVPKWIIGLLAISALLTYKVFPQLKTTKKRSWRFFFNFFDGFLFGLGLHVSGMLNASKTIGFLSLFTPLQFDPSLAMIVLFTIIPNIFVWRTIKKPHLSESFHLANSTQIEPQFLLGNALFGAGWGILGVCPAPGAINAVYFSSIALYWLPSFLLGQLLASQV